MILYSCESSNTDLIYFSSHSGSQTLFWFYDVISNFSSFSPPSCPSFIALFPLPLLRPLRLTAVLTKSRATSILPAHFFIDLCVCVLARVCTPVRRCYLSPLTFVNYFLVSFPLTLPLSFACIYRLPLFLGPTLAAWAIEAREIVFSDLFSPLPISKIPCGPNL